MNAILISESNQQYFRVKPKDTEIIEGQSSDLQCHIGNQAGAVQWSKDGFVLGFDPDIPGYPRYSMIVDERRGVYNLRLKGVQLDDEGEYQCQVGPTHKNHPIRAAARVTVLVPPKMLEIENHANGSILEVREAERITLTCISRHSKPAAKLKWYRNGLLLQGGSFHPKEEITGHRIHSISSTITLYVIMDDSGASYTCEATHRALSYTMRTTITIDVLYPPGIPEIEGYQEGDIVQVGDTLTLACITRGGNPQAELIWYRDNVQVDMSYSTSGREVTNIHTFTVDETDNNAIYRCESSNSVTYHPRIANVKLSVQFAPSKIVIVGPSEGRVGSSISMSCSAGPSNPPSKLTWYIDGKLEPSTTSEVEVSKGGWLTTSNITVTLTRQDPDNKTFACHADSDALKETIKEAVSFSVVYPPSPPSIMGYEEGTPIKSGDFQTFTCVAIGGNPLATLRWFKRDREVRGITSISGSGVFSEIVIRADASDNGAIYRCEAINSATDKALISNIKLTVHFPPSSVTMKITPNRPRAGELVSILCDSGSSNPQSTLHWWRNGEAVSGYDSEVSEAVYGGKSTHSRLDLNVSSKDDEAIFTCQATNNVLERSVHQSLTLRVFFKPEFLVASLEKFDVVEGEILIANLTARANPAVIAYSWRKGPITPIPSVPQGGKINFRVTSRGPLLEIRDSRREDAGQYECEATNSEGTGHTMIVVNVLYPAAVTTVTRSVALSENEDASFECAAIGNPMGSDVVRWRREGFDLGRRSVERLEWGRAHLTVINVTRRDAGVFECVAYNGIGKEAVAKAQLIVKFKPETYLTKRYKKVAAERGETVRLRCLAVGAPIVKFLWSNERGINLTESPNSLKHSMKSSQVDTVTWESILYINNVEDEDFGRYTCTGTNEMGSDSLRVMLNKRGKPDPPEDFKVQNFTSDRVLLSWNPGFDGGSPQFFRIRYMVKGSQEAYTADVLPTNASVFMITGLEPGTEYAFSLMAWNVYGETSYTQKEVSAQTTVTRRLPSTAVDALAKDNEDVSVFLLVVICVSGTLLILINGAIVFCYMQRKKHRQTQGYQVSESKGPPYGSSMYSRDKYHDTINGEALRSPLNEGEETFHEEILMKEILNQDSEPGKSTKIGPKVPPRSTNQRWPTTTESSCPDILKNGHSYVKEDSQSSVAEVTVTDIRRGSLLNDGVPNDPTIFIPPPPLGTDDPLLKPGGATMALGVSAVDLTSGKTKTIVIHPPHIHSERPPSQPSLVALDGHFL
ncbi:nephrin-like [Uloborus diversus]|uniref:nephrin-like n=1 Tax=Uloborus diversus TaxID=327109 RepID=UPI002409DCC4|nr:nephrin-like [Uloborus diversus]